jgi:hypothetical protein
MSRRFRSVTRWAALGFMGLAACDDTAPEMRQLAPATPPDLAAPETLDDLRVLLLEGEPVDVLVTLTPAAAVAAPGETSGTVAPTAGAPHDPGAWAIAAALFEQSWRGSGLTVLHRYASFPMLHVAVSDVATFDRLRADPRVADVYANATVRPSLQQSLVLINRQNVDGSLKRPTNTGAGTSVVVIDTGLEYTRAAFGSCTAGTLNTPSCKVAAVLDTAPDDGALDDHSAKHGTNVAGIVLGVAPGARVIGIDAFSNGGNSGSSSDIIEGLDWAILNRATHNIVAVNMSLGDNSVNTTACGNTVFTTPIGSVLAANIGVIAATGNEGHVNGISSPACDARVISVGAVYDSAMGGLGYGVCSDASTSADKIACYSNGASYMTLLAPGTMITAAGLSLSGTSMAAPHVAGAFAVLRAQRPDDSVSTLATRMVQTGVSLTDTRGSVSPSGRSHRRLDLDAALEAGLDADCVYTIDPDSLSLSPTGETVSVAVSTSDARCTWVVTPSAAWLTVTSGGGIREGSGSFSVTASAQTVSGVARSASLTIAGVVVPVLQDAGDVTAPANGRLVAKASAGQVILTATGISDASGVASMTLRYAEDAVPVDCDAGEVATTGAAIATFTHTGLLNGQTYGYRLCATDTAGNRNAGATVLARPAPEYVRPVIVSALLDGGAKSTADLDVTLSVTGYDISGGLQMCVRNDKVLCTEDAWEALSLARPHTLLDGLTGRRTVYVTVRDLYRNVSKTKLLRINYDVLPPVAGTVRLVGGDAQVTIIPTRFIDKPAGIGRYEVRYAETTPPADCDSGTRLDTPDLFRTYVHTGLTNFETAAYRVCAWDAVGNGPVSATATVLVRPDSSPPAGALTLTGAYTARGVAYVKRVAGQAQLLVLNQPRDTSTLASMCLSTTLECTDWQDYAASVTFSLPAGFTGPGRVYARYRDIWQNESAPVYRAFVSDGAAPTIGTVAASLSGTTLTLTPKSVADAGGAGVKRIKLVYLTGGSFPASDCSNGTVVADSATGAGAHAVSSGQVYRYRACTEDHVGNTGSAITLAVTVN